MSPTSYRTALPRDIALSFITITRPPYLVKHKFSYPKKVPAGFHFIPSGRELRIPAAIPLAGQRLRVPPREAAIPARAFLTVRMAFHPGSGDSASRPGAENGSGKQPPFSAAREAPRDEPRGVNRGEALKDWATKVLFFRGRAGIMSKQSKYSAESEEGNHTTEPIGRDKAWIPKS